MDTTMLLTAEEVAERLRVNVNTVRRYIRSGRLPAIRLGKGYRVWSDDLEAFLRSLATTSSREVEGTEPVSPTELSTIRRGAEDIDAGRYITVDNLEAWREAGAENAARRLEEVEAEISPEELNAYLAEVAKRGKPVRWNARFSEFEEVTQ